MKHDQRLVEFYKKLESRNGFSSEILFQEARLEFRRAWRRDLLKASLGGGATRLKLNMENSWLWLYYGVDDEDDLAPLWSQSKEGRNCRAAARVAPGNPIAARILAARNGCDRLPALPIKDSIARLFAQARAGGGEPGREARYILGPR